MIPGSSHRYRERELFGWSRRLLVVCLQVAAAEPGQQPARPALRFAQRGKAGKAGKTGRQASGKETSLNQEALFS